MFLNFFHGAEEKGKEKKETEKYVSMFAEHQKRGTHTGKWLRRQNGRECDLCLIWALGFMWP